MRRISFIVLGLLFISASRSMAGAWDNQIIGTRSSILPFTGIADDASTIAFNPAGLVYLKTNTLQTVLYAGYSFDKLTMGDISGSRESSTNSVHPGGFMAMNVGPVGVGLGVYQPFYRQPTKIDNGATDSYEDSGSIYSITPACAIEVVKNISIGAGVNINYGSFGYEYRNSWVHYSGVTNTSTSEQKYSGFSGVGGNVGIIYQYDLGTTFGLSYRTAVATKIPGEISQMESSTGATGTTLTTQSGNIEFTTPSIFSLGTGLKLNENALLGIEVQYELWSLMNTITTETIMFGPYTVNTKYRNAITINSGFEYLVIEKLKMQGGLRYNQAATLNEPGSSLDNDRIVISLGASYRVAQNTEIYLSGGDGFGIERTYNGFTYNADQAWITAGIKLDL